MGVGSLSMIVPMYVAECAPPELRGLLIGMQQFAIEFGIMISFWIVRDSRDSLRSYVLTLSGLRHQLHRRNWQRAVRCCMACASFSSTGSGSDLVDWNDLHAFHSSMAHSPWPGARRKKDIGPSQGHASRT